MCGISGIIDLNNNHISPDEIDTLIDAISHRGRDAKGIIVDENVGFGHNRLAVIDLDLRSNQPFFSDDNQYIIVFNGEIFNFYDLRRTVKKNGGVFRTDSDTEVLLNLYRHYGEKCVLMLNGMFAFAVLDKKKKTIFMARDRVGMKPLYYMWFQNKFYFASEVKALTSVFGYQSKLDPESFCEYIFMQSYFPGNTLFKNIKELPPGCTFKINVCDGSVEEKQYWDYQWDRNSSDDYDMALLEANELVGAAVKKWGYANVPIGAYISGGLDSSTVASLLSQCLPVANNGILNTFSSIFTHFKMKDEREFSSLVSENIGSKHHQIELLLDDVVVDHQNHLYVLDYPIGGYSAPYRTLSRYVRKHVKVVLTGHGGDELFCGYPKYLAVLLCQIIESARNNNIENLPNMSFINGFENQIRQIISKSLFQDEHMILYNLLNRTGHLWKYVNPDIKNKVDKSYIPQKMDDFLGDDNLSLFQKSILLDRKILLPALLHIEDRTSMIENLESRAPLLDNDILDLSTMLSQDLLLKNGLKSIMRDIGGSVLPKKVAQNKRKNGTMYPVSELFDGALQPCKDYYFHELDKTGVFTLPAKEIIRHDYSLAQRTQWALFSLGQWFSVFNVGF